MSGNSLPYYPRFPRDFLDGTAGMSLEEKGAYGIILDLIYMSGKRGLPDDSQYIAGQLGTSVRKWNSIRKKLIEQGKIYSDLEIISNLRADKVKINQSKYQDNQAENRRRSNKNNDLKKPSYTDREEPEPKPKEDNAKASSSSDAEPFQKLEHREKILEAMGVEPNAMTPSGRILGNASDVLEMKKWGNQLGLSIDEQCDVVKSICTKFTASGRETPTSFKYFSGAMADFAAQKSQQLTPSDFSKVRGGPRSEADRIDPETILLSAAVGTTSKSQEWPE